MGKAIIPALLFLQANPGNALFSGKGGQGTVLCLPLKLPKADLPLSRIVSFQYLKDNMKNKNRPATKVLMDLPPESLRNLSRISPESLRNLPGISLKSLSKTY